MKSIVKKEISIPEFITKSRFDGLLEYVREDLGKKYNLSIEGVEKSYVKDIYWTSTWTQTRPNFPDPDSLNPHPDDQYIILRNLDDAQFPTIEELMERTLDAPISRIRFYDGSNPMALEGRSSIIEQHHIRIPSSSKSPEGVRKENAIYRFPVLSPIQVDYVNKLFRNLWQSVYDEQENNIQGSPRSRANGEQNLKPINELINRFVTEMTLEVHEDRHYLIFTYEEPFSNQDETNSDVIESEIPKQLDITAVIPLDDDDEANSDDVEYLMPDEDGEDGVLYDMYLDRQNFDSPEIAKEL